MDNKEVKVAKGTKVTYRYRERTGGGAIGVARAICYVDCVHEQTVYVNDRGEESGSVNSTGLYLSEEGKTWVRGWTGKDAVEFKRAVLAEERKRKLAEAKAERERDKKHEDRVVRGLQQAAAAVKRAKLPREFRQAAFAAQFPGSMATMMGPWMLGR